jgi:hypothetical protein
MATGTRGIATRADANIKKSGAYTSDLKRCITKSSAIAAGFTVSGTYANNQLVKYSDLSYTAQLIFKLVVDISSESELYNKGPITLDIMGGALIRPLSYAREVEATEIVNDASGIPLDYSIAHNEESTETNMTLSTVDEVLQVVQEFEEQDQILGAPLLLLGMSLTKDDASTTNLLTSSTYGPVTVSSKKVTFTLLSTTFSSSTAGTYKLSYPGTNGMYLKNKDGLYPSGGLYAGSTSSRQYQTFDVNEGGTWEFNARWVKYTSPIPDPSTPTTTYTFRLRFALNGIAVYQVYVQFTCTIYSSTGAVLGTCSVPGTAYRPYELPADKAVIDSQSYYYIDLWTGTTAPTYVKVSNAIFRHNANNMGNWLVTDYDIQNRGFFGSSPSLSGSGLAYYTLNPRGNIYSVDYLVGGGALSPIDPVLPR